MSLFLRERKILKILKNNQSGQVALVSVVILTAIGLIIASGLSIMVLMEFKMTDNAAKSDQVFTTTEGALSDLLVRIKKDPDWPSAPFNDSVSLNNVIVDRNINGNEVKDIDAVGHLKGITRHLKATFNTQNGECSIFEIEP